MPQPFCTRLINFSYSHESADARKAAQKAYELCVGAANHITSIGAPCLR